LGFCFGLIQLAGVADAGDDGLRLLRSQRRAAVKAASITAEAAGEAAPFGLLVIPVDFADARLPAGWEPGAAIGSRLSDSTDPSALISYFTEASGGRTRLEILLAPLVNLPGERRDYSDIDLNLFTRTRRMATEAAAAVAATGVDFRLVDLDGPDGLPGSGDDDGEIDGVLILHAAPGLENDPENGMVVPLAYYLDEPVVQRGVAARSYAVASLQSELGIWAHETGHLMGLEDRYDPFLPSSGAELSGRGGLGIFSLMAAGAWGVADAVSPALPDAYSCVQLGWLDVADWPGSAEPLPMAPSSESRRAWRVWLPGTSGNEYFLLEVRGGAERYDPLLAEPRLLVYHVDESVPEGSVSSFYADASHLRVRLVEADGDGALAAGENLGVIADLFPGSGSTASWTPDSVPSTDGYEGPTGISFTAISVDAGGVVLTGGLPRETAFNTTLGFISGDDTVLALEVRELGSTPLIVRARVAALSTVNGDFAGGGPVDLELNRSSAGIWRPALPVVWEPAAGISAGAATDFSIALIVDGLEMPADVHRWIWLDQVDPLDPATTWPQDWDVIQAGSSGTSWHLWTVADSPVFVCTDDEASTPGAVSSPTYSNGADVILRSPSFSPGGRVLQLIHRIRVEQWTPGAGPDAAVVEIEDASGTVSPLHPRGGYPQAVDPGSLGALHGRGAFIGGYEGDAGPWRLDYFDLPADAAPVRLRLRFASDPIWRDFGWSIGDLSLVAPAAAADGFTAAWFDPSDSAAGFLVWDWPLGGDADFAVDLSDDQGQEWAEAWSGEPGVPLEQSGYSLDLAVLEPNPYPASRRLLRVRALDPAWGQIACRPVAWHPDGGVGIVRVMGMPWPNPARPETRVLLDLPDSGGGGSLSLIDLRGRRLRRWKVPPGTSLQIWDGTDSGNRALAAGVYLLLLEANGSISSRKVVLVR